MSSDQFLGQLESQEGTENSTPAQIQKSLVAAVKYQDVNKIMTMIDDFYEFGSFVLLD